MKEFTIWKVSQSPKHFTESENDDLYKRNCVCVHPATGAKGKSYTTQGDNFCNIKKGDFFYLCYGNNSIRLFGMFTGDSQPCELENKSDWKEQKYRRLFDSRSNDSYQGAHAWWTPNDNSTFIKCDNNENFQEWILKPFFSKTLKDIEMAFYMEKYVSLLKTNHNLILTGAPGTGKTYLAKQIAKEMGCGEEEIGFVQFHPSYDYTDFVEGLRPVDDNGTVGFERKDGTFKKFCKKALYDELKKDIPLPLLKSSTFDNVYKSLLEDVQSGKINKYKTPRGENPLKIKDNRLQYIKKSPKTESEENMKLLYEHFLDEEKYNLSDLKQKDYYELIKKLTNGKTNTIDYIEYGWTLQVLLDRAKKVFQNSNSENIHSKEESTQLPSSKNFVFIIDEINRGEISKIFGELFFSIDPDYRGEKGRVQTQYQNMVEDGDAFKNGFYVPENVYIIGTMNDIDRSVESMDFAFRRRFAFVEIEADKNVEMLDDLEWKDEAIERMKRLNEAISNTEGLSYAYHIGASYFLKLKNYDGDFNQLWEFHLEGLLREYLRGMQNVEDSIKKLKSAYDNANPNNGQ